MFDKKNQSRFDSIKIEIEDIKALILDVIEGQTARLGTGVERRLVQINEKLNNLDVAVDSIGLVWNIQDSELQSFRKECNELTVLFKKLLAVTQERILLAQNSGKKYVVPLASVKNLQKKWSEIYQNFKKKVEKTNGVRRSLESMKSGKNRVISAINDFFTITGPDYPEDKMVNDWANKSALGEDYQKMIEFVAKGFKVDKKSVCNLPIDILTRMAEQLGWNGSSNSPKGKEPGDE